MAKGMSLGSRDLRMMLDLTYSLGAATDLETALSEVHDLLFPVIGVDCCALAVSRPKIANGYDWHVRNLPQQFLAAYKEMAPYDFVQRSVQTKVGTVVRDAEMIERRELEENMMYRRAHEINVPLEQVMAVMLVDRHDLKSGLSLYRDKQTPFTMREQGLLQGLTIPITKAVRRCWSLAKLASHVTRPGEMDDTWNVRDKLKTLTAMEREVVRRIRYAWSDKEIAQDLGSSPTTVKKHLQNIYHKLGIPDRKVLIAILGGLLPDT